MNAFLFTIGLIVIGAILLVASKKGWIDDQRIANVVAVLAFMAALAVFFIPQASPQEPEPTFQPTLSPIETTILSEPTIEFPTPTIQEPEPTFQPTLSPIETTILSEPIIESPTPTTFDSPSPTSEASEPNWARPFEYRFDTGFWGVGSHEYTIDLICSTLTDDNGNILRESWSVTFQVSDNATLYSTPLYLRLSGIRMEIIEGESVEDINPGQETVGVLTLANLTREEAELSSTDCNATIKWDNGLPEVLVPKEIFQQ